MLTFRGVKISGLKKSAAIADTTIMMNSGSGRKFCLDGILQCLGVG